MPLVGGTAIRPHGFLVASYPSAVSVHPAEVASREGIVLRPVAAAGLRAKLTGDPDQAGAATGRVTATEILQVAYLQQLPVIMSSMIPLLYPIT